LEIDTREVKDVIIKKEEFIQSSPLKLLITQVARDFKKKLLSLFGGVGV
jgi:hypothetical protein